MPGAKSLFFNLELYLVHYKVKNNSSIPHSINMLFYLNYLIKYKHQWWYILFMFITLYSIVLKIYIHIKTKILFNNNNFMLTETACFLSSKLLLETWIWYRLKYGSSGVVLLFFIPIVETSFRHCTVTAFGLLLQANISLHIKYTFFSHQPRITKTITNTNVG